MKRRSVVAIVAIVGLVGSVAVFQNRSSAPVAKRAPGSDQSELPDSRNPIQYKSVEGQFSVTFPSGCSRLQSRQNTGPGQVEEVEVGVVLVSCDRAMTSNEGCMVNALIGAARGLKGQAATDVVRHQVQRQLEGYGVTPTRQTPVRREFAPYGLVEGVDIEAHPSDGGGDVWIRGLLHGENVYVMVAWKAAGGLWEDPEFGHFFETFRPFVD